jgi:hypothetical protein
MGFTLLAKYICLLLFGFSPCLCYNLLDDISFGLLILFIYYNWTRKRKKSINVNYKTFDVKNN